MASSLGENAPSFIPCRRRRIAFDIASRFIWRNARPANCFAYDRQSINPLNTNWLYCFRCFCDHIDATGKPVKAGLSVPDQSVNGLFSGGEPWYLLLPEPDLSDDQNHKGRCAGILMLDASAFPFTFRVDADYTCHIEHVQLAHNFHHCEVRVYENGKRFTAENAAGKPPAVLRGIKSSYRAVIMDNSRLIVWPNNCTKPEQPLAQLSKTACVIDPPTDAALSLASSTAKYIAAIMTEDLKSIS